MKLTVTITLGKLEGPHQDLDDIREALDETIDGLGSIWVQTATNETEYEIQTVTVLDSGA
jgi:hypothetical protein